MARAPFQVLVIPFRVLGDSAIEYAVFRRADIDCWQGIAGGGEDEETPLEAARREAYEEAGIPATSELIALEPMSTMPVIGVCGSAWGSNVLVIPQYCFEVRMEDSIIRLSSEHTEHRWLPYEQAHDLLRWDSNKNALWELDYRLRNGPLT